MAPKSKDVLETLQENIAAVFDQAQQSLTNHRKNCVALYKLHQQAAEVTKAKEGGRKQKLVGERLFSDAFLHMLNRVLVVKKGPPAAEKVIRFVGAYIKFMNERIIAELAAKAEGSQPEDPEETFASRFVDKLMKYMVEGFVAKNKATRYRCISTVSEMIGHLGVIDEDLYEPLRDGLIERASDKESLIRANAIIALSKLAGSEDPDEAEEGSGSILDVIIEALRHDSAPEVRRAALVNIPLLPNTIPVVLSRTRDTDALTRKLVYSSVLPNKLRDPRLLSIEQREIVVKDGLGDREAAVRVAAGKLCVSWLELVSAGVKEEDEEEGTWQGDDGGVMKGLVKFLSLFDVVGGEEAAKDALESIFVTKPTILDTFTFPEEYWRQLTPESAMLARVFMEYCLSKDDEAKLESAGIPVVMAFAFTLQACYNSLVDLFQEMENNNFLGGRDDEEEAMRQEEELAKMEVILRELLKIAWKLDYMDEIGRRKTFAVVRDMLAHPELPPGLINPALDVLKKITGTERDLIRVMVEIIVDLREEEAVEQEVEDLLNDDASEPDATFDTTDSSIKDKQLPRRKPREEMTPEERAVADEKDLRCLTLCIGMLERVDGNFEDNSTLRGVLGDLIIPSVKRKEVPLREKGLACLGLCSLLTKEMALNSFQLFIGQAQSDNEDIQLRALQIIFDLLVVYDQDLLKRSDEMATSLTTFLLTSLENSEYPSVSALLCVGLSKLLLSGLITDLKVLNHLVNAYISPDTASNQSLRQCLSYFFPVYCYSSSVNQRRMAQIFLPTYDAFLDTRSALEEEEEMIAPQTFGLLFVDWTDPGKCQNIAPKATKSDFETDGLEDGPKAKTAGPDAHYDLAIELLKSTYDENRTVEDLKLFCQLLSNLNLNPDLEPRLVHTINVLVRHHEDQAPFNDDPTLKLFKKFDTKFKKACGETLKTTKIKDVLDDDLVQIYRYINVEPPHGDEDYDIGDEDDRTSSRATSVAPTSTSRAESVASAKGGKDEDEEDEEGEQDAEGEEEESTTGKKSQKSRSSKGKTRVKQESGEEEGQDEADEEVLTARPAGADASKKRGRKRSSSESEPASKGEPDGREKRSRVSGPTRGGTAARARGRGRAKAVGRSTRGKAKAEEKADTKKGKGKATKGAGKGRRGKAREDTPEESDEEEEGEEASGDEGEEEAGEGSDRTASPPPEPEDRRKSTRERKSIRQSLAELQAESDDDDEEEEEEDEEVEEEVEEDE